jgi:CBS domain containing-hemolysin-like protein
MFPYDLLTLSLFFLFASAFFSGAETGLLSCSFLKAKNNGLKGDSKSQLLSRLLKNKHTVLIVLLVGTNLSNTLYSLTGERILQSLDITGALPQSITFLGSTLILTPILVIAAEIFPKALFRHYSYTLTRWVTPLIRLAQATLFPLVVPLAWITQQFTGKDTSLTAYNKASLGLLVESGTESGTLVEQQEVLSRHILSLSKTSVGHLMTRCSIFHRVPAHSKPKAVLKILKQQRDVRHDKEPLFIWEENKVVGLLSTESLYKMSPHQKVSSYMQPLPHSSPGQMANTILTTLIHSPSQILMVHSGSHTLGYVTLKSLLFTKARKN